MSRHGRLAAFLAAALAVVLPRTGWACAVCFSATDGNRMAFLGTTIFLSLLPLALIGGGVWYVWKRAKALEADTVRYPSEAASSEL